jgi:hypothetical protein
MGGHVKYGLRKLVWDALVRVGMSKLSGNMATSEYLRGHATQIK